MSTNYFKFLLDHPEHLTESVRSPLLEGGLGKHMQHPFEMTDPAEFLEFWKKFFAGEFDQITEKVDGNNIFWGFSESGNEIVFARNQSEEPFSDPAKKFPSLHPAHESFVIGCNAIKEAISKVPEDLLIKCHLKTEEGKGSGFINTEIIYGEFPNLIQYSDSKQFIVFHNIHKGRAEKYASGEYDNTKALLTELAEACGSIDITIPVATFKITGNDISSVKRVTKKINTIWEFHGPIYIKKDQIVSQLEALKNKFDDIPEVKALKDSQNLSQEEQFDLMKRITQIVGAEILINLESKLFSAKARKTGDKHPKIEGLVIPVGDTNIKITGDFREIKDIFWAPLEKDMPAIIEKLTNFLKGVLDIKSKNKSITAKDVSGMDKDAVLTNKEKNQIKQFIQEDILPTLQKEVDKLLAGDNVKKDNILSTFKLFAFRLKKLLKDMQTINNKQELMLSYISKD